MRQDMIAESRLSWQRFDDQMKKMENKSSFSSMTSASEKVSSEPIKTDVSTTTTTQSKMDSLNLDPEIGTEIQQASIAGKSWFRPIKMVRFPSLFGDDVKQDKSSFFKEENVIKVHF
jgi:hypothetical protein